MALVESTDGEAIERPTVRRCVSCGVPTDWGYWCSTSCHRADEPGAYEDDPPGAYDLADPDDDRPF